MIASVRYGTKFPEFIRRKALAGAELILTPAALGASVVQISLIVLVGAVENGICIAFATDRERGRRALSRQHVNRWSTGVKPAEANDIETPITADIDNLDTAAAR